MKILVDADDLRLLLERNPATESMMQRWKVVQAKGRLAASLPTADNSLVIQSTSDYPTISRTEQRQQAGVAYDREVLVNVLVYHWATSTSGCGCGWAVLGASHPEHVADMYEESVVARAEVTSVDRLAAASDPGVVAIVLARQLARFRWPTRGSVLRARLGLNGITTTEGQARALLDAFAAWDEDARERYGTDTHLAIRARLEAAVTAIVGEQP